MIYIERGHVPARILATIFSVALAAIYLLGALFVATGSATPPLNSYASISILAIAVALFAVAVTLTTGRLRKTTVDGTRLKMTGYKPVELSTVEDIRPISESELKERRKSRSAFDLGGEFRISVWEKQAVLITTARGKDVRTIVISSRNPDALISAVRQAMAKNVHSG